MTGIIRENMYLRTSLLQAAIFIQIISTIICGALLLATDDAAIHNTVKLLFLALEFAFIVLLEEWLTGNHARNINNGFYEYALTSGTNRRQFIATQAILYFGTLACAAAMVAVCQWILALLCPGFWDNGGFSFMLGFALFAFSIDWFSAPLVFSIREENKQTIATFLTGLVVALIIAIPVFAQLGRTVKSGAPWNDHFRAMALDTASWGWLFPLVCIIATCTAIGGGLLWYGWVNRGPICK